MCELCRLTGIQNPPARAEGEATRAGAPTPGTTTATADEMRGAVSSPTAVERKGSVVPGVFVSRAAMWKTVALGLLVWVVVLGCVWAVAG